jgi:hypothetical protein
MTDLDHGLSNPPQRGTQVTTDEEVTPFKLTDPDQPGRTGFGDLQRRCLDRGVFCSLDELTATLENWIKIWNAIARPFKWTKTADQIIDCLCPHCSRISGPGHIGSPVATAKWAITWQGYASRANIDRTGADRGVRASGLR